MSNVENPGTADFEAQDPDQTPRVDLSQDPVQTRDAAEFESAHSELDAATADGLAAIADELAINAANRYLTIETVTTVPNSPADDADIIELQTELDISDELIDAFATQITDGIAYLQGLAEGTIDPVHPLTESAA